MQVVWSLHVQGLALFPGLKRSKGQVSAICTCSYHHRVPCPPQFIYLHYLKVILSVGFYHSSIYSHVGCKVLSHTRSVATTEALNESCKLSLSWTLLTRRRDYLPVKLSQEIIWASIVFLSALSAKAKQHKATC